VVICSRRGEDVCLMPSITPEIEEQLYQLIKAGNYPSIACQAVGLPQGTYGQWMRLGEHRSREANPTPEQVNFANRMREAEALAETIAVKQITDSFDKNPDLALKFLARRHKGRWGESREINVNWTIKALDSIKSGELTLEELELELGTEMTDKVRKMIEAPMTVDGDFTVAPIEEEVKLDAV